ncbi:hypothetical protein [Azospirillum sp. sgz302134]
MEEAISKRPHGAGGPVGQEVDPAPLGVPATVRETLLAEGFHPRDIGGGVVGWNRRWNDGTHVMVSCASGSVCDPARPEWTAGRYGDAGGFVEVNGLTLREALDAVAILPTPRRVDGSLAEGIYPSLEEAMSDFA